MWETGQTDCQHGSIRVGAAAAETATNALLPRIMLLCDEFWLESYLCGPYLNLSPNRNASIAYSKVLPSQDTTHCLGKGTLLEYRKRRQVNSLRKIPDMSLGMLYVFYC